MPLSLILRGSLGAVNYQYLDRAFARFELQPKLLSEGAE